MQAFQDSIPAGAPVEYATLGGGCFWCIEAVFQQIEGVYAAVSGYSGGLEADANYKQVSTGLTRHVEVVQLAFNPGIIRFDEILEIFWTAHDPTTPNRQGNDVGPQYRSAIFYHSDEQRAAAEKSIAEVAPQIWDRPIVTELLPLEDFWVAEEYHQDYYQLVGDRNPYCSYVITPKVKKVREKFQDRLKQ
jgi:peptide-methionine (S)-S-oxide reductase